MTVGIGFLNSRGIVLAADSKAVTENDNHERVEHDNIQKLFQLDGCSGLVIAGHTPYDDPQSLSEPIRWIVQHLRENPPSAAARRQSVLRILAEKVLAYLSESAEKFPEACCRIDTIVGDYDQVQGSLLLACSFQYLSTPEYRSQPQMISGDTLAIHQVLAQDNRFTVRCCRRSESVSISMIGLPDYCLRVLDYLQKCCCPLGGDSKLLGNRSLNRMAGDVRNVIQQIAGQLPESVNQHAQIAIIDKNGFRQIPTTM